MTLEQLQSLTEEEVTMLWGMVNMGTPPVLSGHQLDPELFPFIKNHKLRERVIQFDKYVKPEYSGIYNSLKSKLGY